MEQPMSPNLRQKSPFSKSAEPIDEQSAADAVFAAGLPDHRAYRAPNVKPDWSWREPKRPDLKGQVRS
jgi:hypothetical protein